MLPCLQLRDLQPREVVQQLLHLALPRLELVVQLLVPELDIEQMPKLLGLQLVVLLALLAQLVEQLVAQAHLQLQLVEQLVEQVHLQLRLVESQQVAMQLEQNSSLVQILELGESRLLVH
jgi:hypothetical protein